MARPGRLSPLSGRRCVVALSGGPDSAVAGLEAKQHASSARAVHVHHGFPASDRLAEAATEVARVLGLPLEVIRVQPDSDSETAARAARRPALLAALVDDEVLVTGHTRDDLAETVLIRLIRGTGPDGLAAMSPDDGVIVRPLLDRSRTDVRAMAERAGLPFLDDPANSDPVHLRTRVRQDLLPALAAENPDVVGALARLARHVIPAGHRIPMRLGVAARLPLAALAVAAPDERARAIRDAVTALRRPYPPTTAEVDRVLEVSSGATRRAELDGRLVVLRDRSWLRIGPLPVVAEAAPFAPPQTWGGFAFSVGSDRWGTGSGVVARDSVVRPPEPGDRISIGSGHKSVDDALAEAGIPHELRVAWPVVVGADCVDWLPFVRRAPRTGPAPDGYLVVDARSEEAW